MITPVSFGLGIVILLVSAITGGTLLLAPGSIRLQRPQCGWAGWAFNIINLSFFFILIPFCGLMMISNTQPPFFICIDITSTPLLIVLEVMGVFTFLVGSLLLLWSRLSLRRSFRLPGVMPDQSDYLTLHGPYKQIRHPMYLAALLVLVGITLILASLLMLLMCITMFLLLQKLIPKEEEQLERAYPIAYAEYCRRVPGALFPNKQA